MEEVEKAGWVSEHQNTELDIEFLDVKQILNVEEKEQVPKLSIKVGLQKIIA